MKSFLLATTSLFALATMANAADMPVKAPVAPPPAAWSWTGFYIGVQGGVASHRAEFRAAADAPFLADVESRRTGGAFGGHAGVNLQQGNIVFGLRSDLSWLRARGEATSPFGFNIASFDVPWLGTVRGRLGVTLSPTLLYVTGGVAFGRVNNSIIATFGPGGPLLATIRENRTRTGWTFGGGIEHRLWSNWTVRAEGRYVDLGRSGRLCAVGTVDCSAATAYTGEFKNTLVQALVGLSLKF